MFQSHQVTTTCRDVYVEDFFLIYSGQVQASSAVPGVLCAGGPESPDGGDGDPGDGLV